MRHADPPPLPPSSPAYRRALMAARLLALANVPLAGMVGLIVVFTLRLGGALSMFWLAYGAITLAAVGLPLLLFAPDRGPARTSRRLHTIGFVVLAIDVVAGVVLWWRLSPAMA